MNIIENIQRKKQLIVWLILIILLLVTFFVKRHPVHFDNAAATSIINEIISELFTALLPIVIFGLVYQIYIEQEARQIAKKDIIDSIYSDVKALNLFSIETRMNFIKTIVCSIIGEKYGTLLYNNLIKMYVQGNILYRENFEYDVELFETNNDFSFPNSKVLSKHEYYSLNQTLSYSRHFKKRTKNIGMKIVFAFNDKSLDYWMNDDNVFFREVLEADEWESDFSKYTQEEFLEFLEKCLTLRLFFYNKKGEQVNFDKNYQATYINTPNAKGIEISVKDQSLLKHFLLTDDNSIYYKCKLAFKLPYNKKINRLYFVLPEPTLSPKFTMRFDRQFKNIDYYSYSANNLKKLIVDVDENLSKYSVFTSEIVYPRYGIIFFWK